MAQKLGCTDAAAIIDRHNHWNMPPYFSNSFKMFASGIDPADGGSIALLHHNLTTPAKSESFQIGITVPYQRFTLIDNLLAKGFVGQNYNRQNAGITFVPSKEYTRPSNQLLISPIILHQMKGLHHV